MFRNPVFDVLKGFGIILMIIVHCDCHLLSHFSYTFHMPLFFFISGYFIKRRKIGEELWLNFRRLLVPYIFIWTVLGVISFGYDGFYVGEYSKKSVLSALWGGAVWGTFPFSTILLFAGPTWFLLALFWIRTAYSISYRLFNRVWLGVIISLALAFISQYFVKKYGQLPGAILPALGSFGFFYAGVIIKKFNLLENAKRRKLFPVCIVCWLYCLGFSKLALHDNTYAGFYVIDLLGALGAFFVLYAMIKEYYVETGRFWSLLNFIGKNSIVVLSVHAIDHCFLCRWTNLWMNLEMVGIPSGRLIITLLRLLLAICTAYIIVNRRRFCNFVFYSNKR